MNTDYDCMFLYYIDVIAFSSHLDILLLPNRPLMIQSQASVQQIGPFMV